MYNCENICALFNLISVYIMEQNINCHKTFYWLRWSKIKVIIDGYKVSHCDYLKW